MGQAARAEEAEEPGWIPAIDLGFETFTYDADANVQNHVNPPVWEGAENDPTNQLRFQFDAELMSPRLPLPGRPRLFVSGGAGLGTPSSDRILGIGNLNGIPEDDIAKFKAIRQRDYARGCREVAPPTCLTKDADKFEGQGSYIETQITDPTWHAALGVAFEIPLARSLLLQLKPSVAYNVETVDLIGQMTTVELTNPDPVAQDFAVHRSTGHDSITDHRLGAGFELALVLFRSLRPVTTALYVDGRFLWAMGDTEATFSDPGGLATYTVDREEFTMRGGAGLRFSWLGFGAR